MHFQKENERVRIYIPANSLKSAAPPQACRSLLLKSAFARNEFNWDWAVSEYANLPDLE